MTTAWNARAGLVRKARMLADSFSDEIEVGASHRERGTGGKQAGTPGWAARIQPSATDEIRRFLRELSDLLGHISAPVLHTYCAFAGTPGGCKGDLGLCGDATVCEVHYGRALEIQLEAAGRTPGEQDRHLHEPSGTGASPDILSALELCELLSSHAMWRPVVKSEVVQKFVRDITDELTGRGPIHLRGGG